MHENPTEHKTLPVGGRLRLLVPPYPLSVFCSPTSSTLIQPFWFCIGWLLGVDMFFDLHPTIIKTQSNHNVLTVTDYLKNNA